MSNSLGMITRGRLYPKSTALTWGHGMGEHTAAVREVRNGHRPSNSRNPVMRSRPIPSKSDPHAGHGAMPGMQHQGEIPAPVPGYPQGMMGMHSEAHIKKFNKPEMRGMRATCFAGVKGLMTVLRVLPQDLYGKVMSAEIASVPGESGEGHQG